MQANVVAISQSSPATVTAYELDSYPLHVDHWALFLGSNALFASGTCRSSSIEYGTCNDDETLGETLNLTREPLQAAKDTVPIAPACSSSLTRELRGL